MSFWRLYIEIIIPMMKFTFLTCAILLSLGVVKAYDIVVAMTNGGPGQSTWTPAYFAINAYSTRSNIGFASAAAVIMLLITARDLPAAGAAHRLAGAPARGGRDMTVAAAHEPSRRRRRQRAALSAPEAGASRGSSIAILVFLTMCAPFFCVPLYVVIVTSFKTDGPDRARRDLRAAR